MERPVPEMAAEGHFGVEWELAQFPLVLYLWCGNLSGQSFWPSCRLKVRIVF